MSASLKIIILYILIYALIPLLGFIYFGQNLWSSFNYPSNSLNFLVFISIAVTLFYFYSLLFVSKLIPDITFPYIHLIYSRKIILVLGFFFVFIGIRFYQIAGIEFRHSGDGLSSLGAIGFLSIILKVYFTYALFLICAIKKESIDKIIFLLIAIGFFLNLDTAIEAIPILISTLGFLGFYDSDKNQNKNSLAMVFIYTSTIFAVLYVGVVNKINPSDLLNGSGNIRYLLTYFIERFSVHFYSLILVLDNLNLWSFEQIFIAINFEINLISYNLLTLFGLDSEKPILEGITRLNVLSLYPNPRDIGGASPGPVVIFLISPPVILGWALNILVSSFLLKRISSLVEKKNNFIFALYAMLNIQLLWESYISLFSIISIPMIYLIFLLGSSERLKKMS